MRRIAVAGFVLLTLLGFGGCSTTTAPQPRFGYEAWQHSVSHSKIDSSFLVYPFTSTPEIEQWAHEVVGATAGEMNQTVLGRLQRAMFQRQDFSFTFKQDLTLTAAEAFTEQQGNCLSFTALFVTAARSLGLQAFLVSVRRPPEVEKQGNLVVVNDHVVAGYTEAGQLYTYDFSLRGSEPFSHTRVIDDVAATALYHNNLGGAAIGRGELELAVEHLEVATALDPMLAAAWVNLGVAYQRLDRLSHAIEAYHQALEIDPSSSSALNNLASVFHKMGLYEQSHEMLQLAAEQRSTPFVLITLAETEMSRGNLDVAWKMLNKARRIDRDEPEVYLALARLAVRAGDIITAGKFRSQARRLLEHQEAAANQQLDVTDG